jgi:hypothetical protein
VRHPLPMGQGHFRRLRLRAAPDLGKTRRAPRPHDPTSRADAARRSAAPAVRC